MYDSDTFVDPISDGRSQFVREYGKSHQESVFYTTSPVHIQASSAFVDPSIPASRHPDQVVRLGNSNFDVYKTRNSQNIDSIHTLDEQSTVNRSVGSANGKYDNMGSPVDQDTAFANTLAGTRMERLYFSENPGKISAAFCVSTMLLIISFVVGLVGIITVMTDVDINVDTYHVAMSIILLICAIVGIIIVVRALESEQRMGPVHRKRTVILIISTGIALITYWICFSLWTMQYSESINRHNPKEFGQYSSFSTFGVIAFLIASAFYGDAWISTKYPQFKTPDTVVFDKNKNLQAILSKQQVEAMASTSLPDKFV